MPKSAKKFLVKIPLPWSFRISQAIDRLAAEPYLGDKMSVEQKDKRKIRVWPYRIVYMVKEKTKQIFITEIEHRGNVSYD